MSFIKRLKTELKVWFFRQLLKDLNSMCGTSTSETCTCLELKSTVALRRG